MDTLITYDNLARFKSHLKDMLPTVGSGVLTISQNGVAIGTFSANDADNKTVNITMSTVAVTGNYNDLSNKPTIAASVGSLTDVSISTLADGEILKYNESTGKWENSEADGGTKIQIRAWTMSTQA